jgi:hypothetical protein
MNKPTNQLTELINLTPHQEGLIASLVSEFNALNQITVNDDKRFSPKTIFSTEAEKGKLISEMIKYNKAIMSSEVENLKKQVKAFNEEYKDLIKVHTDYQCTPEEFRSYIFNKYEKGLNLYQGELKASLYFVSIKLKNNNYANLMHEETFTMQFEGNKVEYILSDGSKVTLFKVERLVYSFNKTHEESKTTYHTIEEMIQSETKLQEGLKRLVFPKP